MIFQSKHLRVAILFVSLCFSFSLSLASQNDYKEWLNYDESTPLLGITAIEFDQCFGYYPKKKGFMRGFFISPLKRILSN